MLVSSLAPASPAKLGAPLAFERDFGSSGAETQFSSVGAHDIAVDSYGVTFKASSNSNSIRLRFKDALPGELKAGAVASSRSNYFVGSDPSEFRLNVPNYTSLRRDGLYPGIDVVYYGTKKGLEYDLLVSPRSDASVVKFVLDGVGDLNLESGGELTAKMPAGASVVKSRPVAYQVIDGQRTEVQIAYRVVGKAVSFVVGAYDAKNPLIIDPVISYGSYEGVGSYANAIALDAAGNAYIAGKVMQSSANTFQTVSAYDATIARGDTDAFVQKMNPTGTSLIYSTYVGGTSATDEAMGIAVDGAGNAYVTGTTTGTSFPTTTGAYQLAPASGGGSFAFKLGPSGNTLVYSTYIKSATASAIARDASGSAYITGYATAGYATTSGAYQTTLKGTQNAFVLKLNATGTAAAYSTLIGGSSADQGNGIALDASGSVYVAGGTTSTNFPTTVGAFQPASAGAKDAFVAKLNAAGSALLYSTYVGGDQDDFATAIAIDASNNAYITGNTHSFTFPVLNAFQSQKGGVNSPNDIDNAFVTKLNAAGNLVYSSFLGGAACTGGGTGGCLLFGGYVDKGMSIAVDAQGHAFVGGATQSISFPRVDSLQPAFASGGGAGFVAKVSQMGGALLFSTLLGDSAQFVRGLAVDATGNAYGAGPLTNFPTTPGPYQSLGGSAVFKITSGSASVGLTSAASSVTEGQPVTLTATYSSAPQGASIIFMDGAMNLGPVALSNGSATLSTQLPSGVHGITAIYRDGSVEMESPVVYLVVNPPAQCN